MYLVRWQFQVRFGHMKEVLSILRQWEIDVGQRVGFRAQNLRVSQGMLGVSRSTIEVETRMDNLSDLENAWADMERNPHHPDAMKALEPFVVGGTDRWCVHSEIDLFDG